MPSLLDRLAGTQHLAAAFLTAWLLATSPWVVMLRQVPVSAGFFEYAHVALGVLALLVSVTYAATCLRAGGWRAYFPWASGRLDAVGSDLGGLARGRIPSAEGAGLFAAIKGLLLLAFLSAAATGTGWLLAQGSAAALAWRECHILLAWTTGALFCLHVVAVSLHLLEFVRD